MKSIPVTLLFVVAYFTVLTEGLFRQRRHDMEIKNRKGETIHGKAGIPLVFGKDKQAYMRTGIPELRKSEDVDTTGDSTLRDMSEDEEDMDSTIVDDNEDSESRGSEKEDEDNDDDEESQRDKDKKNPEELGEGYEKIDLGSDNKDDDEDEESKGSKGEGSTDEDIMDQSPGAAVDSKGKLDLHGDFPPNANQVNKLPKDEELTPEQAAKKIAEKRKGYVQFTIKQRFQPELKYKESAAYKILAGNVIEDVQRALKSAGIVRDVLFREAKDVGGPPYRSKVQVFLKLQKVNLKKLKRMVDYGLINGMITIPGSFYA